MRVIFSNYDAPTNPFYGGGGATAIHEVARRLAVRHHVTVLHGAFTGSAPAVRDGVHYQPLGPCWAGPKLGQLLFQFSLIRMVRRLPFDLWCESLTPPFSTACLQRFTKRPIVALTQILSGAAMRQKYGLPFDRVERLGLRTYRWAIATSNHLKRFMQSVQPALRVAVIPNGVPGEWLRCPPEEPGGRHILFLGRLDMAQKGIDLLIEALTRFQGGPPLPVVMAGTGSPQVQTTLHRRLKETGLSPCVSLPGRIAGEAKRLVLRDAAFMVMPSRFEASPLVLLEAACHRLPTVSFAIPELADVPEDIGLKVRPFDIDALAAAITRLCQDHPFRQTLGEAAWRYAQDFDWDRIATHYERFFVEILETT